MNLPDQLVAGPDDTNDGVAWVEDGDKELGKGVAIFTPATQISDPHPERRKILEEMVRRYNSYKDMAGVIGLVLQEHTNPQGIDLPEWLEKRVRNVFEKHDLRDFLTPDEPDDPTQIP